VRSARIPLDMVPTQASSRDYLSRIALVWLQGALIPAKKLLACHTGIVTALSKTHTKVWASPSQPSGCHRALPNACLFPSGFRKAFLLLAKGDVAMTIASPPYNRISNSRWIKLSRDGILTAFSEHVPRFFGELQP
jgi:hypothetical protein